jgi:hypothetical protein
MVGALPHPMLEQLCLLYLLIEQPVPLTGDHQLGNTKNALTISCHSGHCKQI